MRIHGPFVSLGLAVLPWIDSSCWFGQAVKIAVHTRKPTSAATLSNGNDEYLLFPTHVVQKDGIPLRICCLIEGTRSVKLVNISKVQRFLSVHKQG